MTESFSLEQLRNYNIFRHNLEENGDEEWDSGYLAGALYQPIDLDVVEEGAEVPPMVYDNAEGRYVPTDEYLSSHGGNIVFVYGDDVAVGYRRRLLRIVLDEMLYEAVISRSGNAPHIMLYGPPSGGDVYVPLGQVYSMLESSHRVFFIRPDLLLDTGEQVEMHDMLPLMAMAMEHPVPRMLQTPRTIKLSYVAVHGDRDSFNVEEEGQAVPRRGRKRGRDDGYAEERRVRMRELMGGGGGYWF